MIHHPERWRRTEELCHLALSRPEGERASFLVAACGADEELRLEVERLLAQESAADGFLDGSVSGIAAGVLYDADQSPPASVVSTVDPLSSPPSSPADAQTTVVGIDDKPKSRERYALTRLHASGGIGRVWVARDTAFGRNVALKELRPEHAGLQIHRTRFIQEARITGQLEHPGIVPVYELASRPDQQPFYTMRFVKGRTLADAARTYHNDRTQGLAGMLDLVPLLNSFVTVCNTVAYAHSRGVIHRDLKGENVVLGDFGEVVVLDWGLATLVEQLQGEPVDPVQITASSDSALTSGGQTMGTPAYMAPEQASGRVDLIDRRTDVYGLGAILYQLLTGNPPFSGSNNREILQKVCEERPRPVRELWSHVPSALEEICLHALAKKPNERFASASELGTAVQNWQEIERQKAREDRDRFFTLALDLMCIAGFDGYFKRVNPAFTRALGFTADEMLSEPYLNFVHPDDRERTVAAAGRLIEDTSLMKFENRYRCKDGSYKWLEWTGTVYAARQLVYAVARVVTDLKTSA
jgi:serine/threonine-protein kinase